MQTVLQCNLYKQAGPSPETPAKCLERNAFSNKPLFIYSALTEAMCIVGCFAEDRLPTGLWSLGLRSLFEYDLQVDINWTGIVLVEYVPKGRSDLCITMLLD